MPSRKSKQAGTHGCEQLTYAERRALGYGTQRERLGADSLLGFDCCNLELDAARDPVATPGGVLYSREAVVRALLQQRKDIARKLEAYERDRAAREEHDAGEAAERADKRLAAFHAANHGGGVAAAGQQQQQHTSPTVAGASSVQATAFERDAAEGLKSFWVPSLAPEAAAKVVEKPDQATRCPKTNDKLRLKDLVSVSWTMRDGRPHCPVCSEAFSNATQIVVLKPTGDAVCEGCFKRFVLPDGGYGGKKVRGEKDVVRLRKPGTGFAAAGGDLQASAYKDLAGFADGRGQSRAGGNSAFGLNFR